MVNHTQQQQKTSLQKEHLQGMEHLKMSILSIQSPYPSIARIVGKIHTEQPDNWGASNPAMRLLLDQPNGQSPISRVYTIRSFDEASSEIEIDMVKHEGTSPAMQWLDHVSVGDTVDIIGARPHFTPNFDENKHVIMFADDTAIPAIYSILSHWKKGVRADIYVESHEKDILLQLPKNDLIKMHLHHVKHDDSVHHAQQGWLLSQAYAIQDLNNKTIWAACERNEARALREYFVENNKMLKADVQISGYWKSGISSTELDEVRARHYLEHTQQGKTLAEYDDLDMPS